MAGPHPAARDLSVAKRPRPLAVLICRVPSLSIPAMSLLSHVPSLLSLSVLSVPRLASPAPFCPVRPIPLVLH